jgi:hypothetical protein
LHAGMRTTRGFNRLVVEERLPRLKAKGIGDHRGGSTSNGMRSPQAWRGQASFGATESEPCAFGRLGDDPTHAPRSQSRARAGKQRDPQRTSRKANDGTAYEVLAQTGHCSRRQHGCGVRGNMALRLAADRWGIALEIEMIDVDANQRDET